MLSFHLAYVSLSILVSSGYMPRSGIAGSHALLFSSFLRSLHTVFLCGLAAKESACNAGDLVRSLGGEDPPEKGTALHYG